MSGARRGQRGRVGRPRAVAGSLAAGIVMAAALAPPAADAHGLGGREDLPIPDWLFGWAAAAVLVVSFLALGALWRAPLLQGGHERPLGRVPRWLPPVCGAVGVASFVGLVWVGFSGSQTITRNLLPTTFWVLIWVGLVPLSAMFGDGFAAFNPWRATARGAGWIARRAGAGVSSPVPYPGWLGRWPAVVSLLAIGWTELVAADGSLPQRLALLACLYAAVQLVGMALFGERRWSRDGDALGVLMSTYARLSPLVVRDRRLMLRRPLEGLSDMEFPPGGVALLCAAIGITAFDGAKEGAAWGELSSTLQPAVTDIGLGQTVAQQAVETIGLFAAVAFVAAVYRIGVWGMQEVARDTDARTLSARFAPTLVPIALAYVLAHYFSMLLFQGQGTIALLSDPRGTGSDLLGTAGTTIDYSLIGATGIWFVQVALLLVGHGVALAVGHDRGLAMFGDSRTATRSQWWMLAVMVCFTSLGLWLLSEASA